MNRIVKRVFIFSFIFYCGVSIYTRFTDSAYSDFWSRLIFSLPLDFLEGKDKVDMQICKLSATGVAELLRTNPKYCAQLMKEEASQDYVVIRMKHDTTVFGEVKCYFSCFPFPIVFSVHLPGMAENYLNLIYPYPALREGASEKCDISVRWKNYGG